MASVSKQYLSGSSTGKSISVVATATAGTTIHDADNTAMDEVWLWACNTSASSVDLTIEYGASAAHIVVTLAPKQGLVPILPGTILNTDIIRAYATTTAVVYVVGYVNRIA